MESMTQDPEGRWEPGMERCWIILLSMLAAAATVAVWLGCPVLGTRASSEKVELKPRDADERAVGSASLLQVTNPRISLGQIAAGRSKSAKFVLENVSDVDIGLVEAIPSCSCTVIKFPSVIASGRSGTIHAEVKASGAARPIVSTMRVKYHALNRPSVIRQLTLTVQGQLFVPGVPRPRPAVVDFRDIQPGALRKALVELSPADGDDSEIRYPGSVSVDCGGHDVAASLTQGPSRGQANLHVELRAGSLTGSVAGTLEVPYYASSELKKLVIPVRAYVVGPLDISPATLIMPLNGRKQLTKTLSVEARTGGGFEFRQVRSDTNTLAVRPYQGEAGKHYVEVVSSEVQQVQSEVILIEGSIRGRPVSAKVRCIVLP